MNRVSFERMDLQNGFLPQSYLVASTAHHSPQKVGLKPATQTNQILRQTIGSKGLIGACGSILVALCQV